MTTPTNDNSTLDDWQQYNSSRINEGLLWAFVFALIALVWGLWVLGDYPERITIGPNVNPVVNSNPTVQASNVSIPVEVVRDTPCPPSDSGLNCDSWSVFDFLIRSLGKMLNDVVAKPEVMTVSWYFRWLTFLIIFCSTPVFYRAHLSQRHRLLYDTRQEKIATKIRWTYIINKFEIGSDNGDDGSKPSPGVRILSGFDWLLSKVGLILTMIAPILLIPFAAYIVTSSASRSLELMFVGVAFSWQQVLVLGVGFAFLFAYLIVQVLSIIDTYELFFIAAIVIGLGFGWGFSVAETIPAVDGCGDRWYCHSISMTGVQTSSGIIFTMTMLAIGYFLLLIWHDVSTYLNFVMQNKEHIRSRPQPRKTNRFEQALINWDKRWHWTYRLIVIGFLLLIGVGIFPTISTVDIPLNVVHLLAAMSGTGLLIIAGKFWLTWIVLGDILPAQYRYTTLIMFVVDCLMIIYYFVVQKYIKIIPLNLTGLELYLLLSIGIWFYGLAENILNIMNELEYVYNENRELQTNGQLSVHIPPKQPWHIVIQNILLYIVRIPLKVFNLSRR